MPQLKVDLIVDDQGSLTIKKFSTDTDRYLHTAAGSVKNLAGQLTSLTGILSGVAIGAMARQFSMMADSMALMQGKLALVNGDFEQLYEIAQKTRQGLEPTVELYARLARATQEYGYSQAEVLQVVESVQQAIVVSGASAAESEAAIIQLSQGMASGVLRGEELNSVMEQTPRVARMIAEGLGVTIGQLREMGQEGELTTDKLMTAFRNTAAGVEAEFEQMPLTISQAFTVLSNSTTTAIGQMDQMSGSSASVARAIVSISEAVEETPRYFAGLMGLLDGARAGFTEFIIGIEEGYQRLLEIRLAIAETVNDNAVGDFLVPDSVIISTKRKISELEKSIGIWREVLDDTNKSGERHAAIFSGLIPVLEKAKTKTAGMASATKDNSAALTEQEKAIDKVDAALERYFETLDKTVRKLEEERIAALDSFYSLTEEQEMERINDLWQDRIDRQKEAERVANEHGKAEQQRLQDYEQAFEHMLENLQDYGADFFYDWFSGAENGWKNLMGNLKDYFIRMLAELAAAAVARPIIISVIGSAAGTLGLGDTASAASGSNGSLLNDLSIVKSLSSAFGGHGGIMGNLSSAAGWGWIQDAAGAMVDFSSDLAGVAEAFSNFGGWVESLPVIGKMGISGVMSAGAAVYDLSQGNTRGAVVHGIGAGLSYVNPLYGAAWELGNMVGGWIGGGHDPDPEYKARYQSWSANDGGMRWTNTGTEGRDLGQQATNQIDAAIKSLFRAWDKNIKTMVDAMGDAGEKWEKQIKYRYSIGMNQDIDSAADIDTLLTRMNDAIFSNLVPTLNKGLDIFWADARADLAQLPAWRLMSREWVAGVNSQVAKLPRLLKTDTADQGLEKFNNFLQEVAGVQQWMAGVDQLTGQIREALSGQDASKFEQSYMAIEKQYAEWASQLEQIGVNLKRFPELTRSLNKSLQELTAGAFDEIRDVIDRHELSEDAYRIKSGMPAIQEWYDEQLAMLDFLKSEGRLNRKNYLSWLTDLNKAMEYKMDDLTGSVEELQVSADAAINQWDDFFRSMRLSSLAPGQSIEGYLAEYQTIKNAGDFSALADFVKGDFLPFVQSYTAGTVDYATIYNSVMSDLQKMSYGGASGSTSVTLDAASTAVIAQAVASGMLSITDSTGKEIVINLNLDSRTLDTVIAGLITGGGVTFEAIQAVG